MKWFWVVLLFLFGLLLFGKGIELWFVQDQVDAMGIDVHFLGFELMGGALKESLSVYAFGFIVSALIPIVVAINLMIKIKRIDKNRHIA